MNKKIALVSLTSLVASIANSADRPNILYIMADDQSPNTVGAYNSFLKDVVQTPNIDRLAKEGAMFNHCIATNSLCAPSRSSIITGQYCHSHGVCTLRENLDTKELPTSNKILKEAGYTTAAFGKWHIHGDSINHFDDYALNHSSQGTYFDPKLGGPNGKITRKGYATDVYTDLSLEWLDKRDKTKPFFLMTHYKAAHGPWQYAPRHKDLFADITIPEPPTLWDDYKNRFEGGVATNQARIHDANHSNAKMNLSFWFEHNKKGKKGKNGEDIEWPTGKLSTAGKNAKEIKSQTYQKLAKDYLRCIKAIDEGVGRMLEYLEKEGILNNTIVIYTADQGFYVGEHGFFDKRLGFEEGIHMPFLMRYPKEIKAGTVVDDMINNVDFAQTIIDYSGEKAPDTMQGISFRDLVAGRKPKKKRDRSFYSFYSSSVAAHYGVRTNNYKLLKYMDRKGNLAGADLFDLKKDPNEMVNQYNNPEYASVVAMMEKSLADERSKIGATDKMLPGEDGWRKSTASTAPKKKSRK